MILISPRREITLVETTPSPNGFPQSRTKKEGNHTIIKLRVDRDSLAVVIFEQVKLNHTAGAKSAADSKFFVGLIAYFI